MSDDLSVTREGETLVIRNPIKAPTEQRARVRQSVDMSLVGNVI